MTVTTAAVPDSHRGTRRAGFSWRTAVQVAVVVAATAVLFFQPFLELVHVKETSVDAHIEFAREIARTGHLFPGHFLFHIATVFVHWASGLAYQLTWDQANVVVNVGARVLTAVILWVLVRRAIRSHDTVPQSVIAMVLPVALLFASAVTMPTWDSGNYYLGYIPPNIYLSQTMVVVQPLALLTFFVTLRVLDLERRKTTFGDVVILAVVAVLSVLAKPSYAMIMVPAVGIILLTRVITPRGIRNLRPNLLIAAVVFVPVMIAMTWIYTSTYLDIQAGLTDVGGSGIAFRPFDVMHYLEGLAERGAETSHITTWVIAKFWLSIAFPLVVAIAYWPTVRRDLRFQLGWLQLLFGLMFTYLFAETGSRSGNFTWSAQVAVFILMVLSALFLLEQARREIGEGRLSRGQISLQLLCWAVFALHVIGGFGPYLHPKIN